MFEVFGAVYNPLINTLYYKQCSVVFKKRAVRASVISGLRGPLKFGGFWRPKIGLGRRGLAPWML